MTENIRAVQMFPGDYPLEDAEYVTYIYLGGDADEGEGTVVFVGSDDKTYGHQRLLDEAIDEGLVDVNAEVLGGGHLRADSLRLERHSHAFGPVPEEIVLALADLLRSGEYEEWEGEELE